MPNNDTERCEPNERLLWKSVKEMVTDRVRKYYQDYGNWGEIDEGELKNDLRMYTDTELMGL